MEKLSEKVIEHLKEFLLWPIVPIVVKKIKTECPDQINY